jgi:hypothetical protein
MLDSNRFWFVALALTCLIGGAYVMSVGHADQRAREDAHIRQICSEVHSH